MDRRNDQSGLALVTVMMLLAMLAALLGAYFAVTRIEIMNTRSSMDATRGFYAAEAGLNLRAEEVRQTFLGFSLPVGESPEDPAGQLPCQGGDQGSGDFACETFEIGGREVLTFVSEKEGNPSSIVIPPGELYKNLYAQEYAYMVRSIAVGDRNRPEAVLDLQFVNRLVPMFQFAAFYDKDLEILPGKDMTLEGPIHTNGNLYVGSLETLTIASQITVGNRLYHGRKDDHTPECTTGSVYVYDPTTARPLPACSAGRREILDAELGPWNDMIRLGVDQVTVPPPDTLDPSPGKIYWDLADVRIMLDLTDGNKVKVKNPDGSTNTVATNALASCSLAARYDSGPKLYNHREGATVEMLDVDVRRTLSCMHTFSSILGGKALSDDTHGGLVWYLGVIGPDDDVPNNYGVRVLNGERLAAMSLGFPAIKGLTVVTNQAVYIQGNYNSVAKKPAAFLADTLNILSNGWSDATSAQTSLASRQATDTTINAAFLAATDTTGGVDGEGEAGHGGKYNGGLENYPRLHEDWEDTVLRYRGSFVSLGQPRHADGVWAIHAPYYEAPDRDWAFDTDLRDPKNLPPLSPRFVYLTQILFVRDFEL
jgi:hypothetical protein